MPPEQRTVIHAEESQPQANVLPLGEQWLKALLESLGQAVIATTPEGRIIYWNHQAEAMYGWKAAEVLHQNIVDVVPTEVSRQQATELMAKLASGGSWSGVFQARRKDNSLIWVQVTDSPILDAEGMLKGIVGCSQDISLIRRLEADLHRNEERLRLSQRAGRMGSWDWDFESGVTTYTGMYFDLHGIAERDLSFEDALELVHSEDRGPLAELIRKVKADGGEFETEYRVVWPDGSIHWLASRGGVSPDIDGKKGHRMLGVVYGIDQRKASEFALRHSEQRFRTLTNTIPQMLWTCDSDGLCDYLSQQWLDYTGIPEAEQLGSAWMQQIHPSDRDRLAEEWNTAVRSRTGLDTEFRIRRADGQFRWFKTRATPLLDEQGRIAKWFGSNTDIEDRKRTEEALIRANEELAQFAYSASHDLQEPLRNISLYSQLLARRHSSELQSEGRMLLDSVIQSAKRMSDLIRDLLSFNRAAEKPSHVEPVPASIVLQKALTDLHASMSISDAEVTSSELPLLPMHPTHLHQVLLNLLSNAIRYQQPHSKPLIHVSATRQDAEWLVCVDDNGIGVAQEDREQIFGLFKRLHGRHVPGTGMGLPICRRIVEQYGGRIWCEAKPRPGSRFCFTIPAA